MAAGADRNLFRFGQCNPLKRLKIGGYGRWQRRHLKINLKGAGIAIHIAHRNIEGMRSRRHACGFNDITVIGRNKLSIKRIFDAGDVLIGLDVHHHRGGFRQRRCEQVGRQGQQGDWNRRAQDGAAGCASPVCCGNVQRKIVASAVSRDGRIYRDDVLRAEQIGEAAVNGDQFLWPRQIIKNSVRFAGDRFQETLVDVPA